jgi:quercetin dioxygenase-like cupin family protein
MFQFAFAAVAVTKLAAPASTAREHVSVSADQLKWMPAPPAFAKGAEMAVVAGDPSKKGMYVIRLKAPAGYIVPPHSHPLDEHVTVISGSLIYETGDKVDEKKAVLKAGGFAKMPKGKVHYDVFVEDTVIQVHGEGPQGITFVNAADDPRKR